MVELVRRHTEIVEAENAGYKSDDHRSNLIPNLTPGKGDRQERENCSDI